MKKTIPALLLLLALASCNGWFIQPLPKPPTPFLPPTNTPSVFTATPVVIGVPSSTPQISTLVATATSFVPLTSTFTATSDRAPSFTPTSSTPRPAIVVEVLGCNTSIDVTHGMGEVTNAFITLKNIGNITLTNLMATLFALDEGREHPDKTVEVTSLLVGYEVTLKLTVDSTYQEETPIQVEVNGDDGLFQRVGAAACRDIGLFAPKPDGLSTPVPSNP